MPQLTSCPDVSMYQLLATAGVALDDAEALLAHLEQCDACGERVRDLPRDDTLTKALANSSTLRSGTIDPEEDVVRGLIERIRRDAQRPREKSTNGATTAPIAPNLDFEWTQLFAPAQAADEIGRLDGYRILRKLGEGGMGAVFLAEDLRLKRRVALKVMKEALQQRAGGRERFAREAQAAAAIEHEHIVTVYQVGEDRGLLFLAMQLLAGENLDDRLKREGKLPTAEVIRIGTQIAAGLAAAHAKGLIHRDIKPANVWLEVRGASGLACSGGEPNEAGGRRSEAASPTTCHVKILDFGLARLGGDDTGTRITQSGVVVGTPAYMAPEQARGNDVDHRADLFSLKGAYRSMEELVAASLDKQRRNMAHGGVSDCARRSPDRLERRNQQADLEYWQQPAGILPCWWSSLDCFVPRLQASRVLFGR